MQHRSFIVSFFSRLRRVILFVIVISFIRHNYAYPQDSPKLNVILVSINALRADHMSTYRYIRDTTPNITKFSKRAVVFENAISQSNWTMPSLAAMFTSKYIHSLGLYTRENKLSDKEITLAEILKLYGYKTAAFTGGLDMSASFGLKQGFDYYYDETRGSPMGRLSDIIPSALEWLKENINNKFFMFIDGYDVHPPFNYPEPYQEMFGLGYNGIIDKVSLDYHFLKDIQDDMCIVNGKEYKLSAQDLQHIIAHYDAGIAYADYLVGKLLKEIDHLGLMNKTIIIITSEHGEELLEHGSFDRYGKGNLYEEVLHVPLLVYYPFANSKNKRVNQQVKLIDIMPTVLELLGYPCNKESQGVSFAGEFLGNSLYEEENRYAYSEASMQKWSVRTNLWKLIYNEGKYELYNLKEDKYEKNNLALGYPDIVYDLSQRLHHWRKITETGSSPESTHIELSQDMKKKLREAGYW